MPGREKASSKQQSSGMLSRGALSLVLGLRVWVVAHNMLGRHSFFLCPGHSSWTPGKSIDTTLSYQLPGHGRNMGCIVLTPSLLHSWLSPSCASPSVT